jgi:hypothetical protein
MKKMFVFSLSLSEALLLLLALCLMTSCGYKKNDLVMTDKSLAANRSKLIFYIGRIRASTPVTDEFITVQAAYIFRDVFQYQWCPVYRRRGEKVRRDYLSHYEQKWSRYLYRDNDREYANPDISVPPITNRAAERIMLGDFEITSEIHRLVSRARKKQPERSYYEVPRLTSPEPLMSIELAQYHKHGNSFTVRGYTLSTQKNNIPVIGDSALRYYILPLYEPYTVIAIQKAGSGPDTPDRLEIKKIYHGSLTLSEVNLKIEKERNEKIAVVLALLVCTFFLVGCFLLGNFLLKRYKKRKAGDWL